MKKTTLERRKINRQNTSMKKMMIRFPKNVSDHDDRFINRCQVRLCEDNQVYIPSSTLPALQYRRMLDSYEKEKQYCYASVSSEKKEKCLLDHLAEKRRNILAEKFSPLHNHYNLVKTRSQFGAPRLETFVVSIQSLYLCLSSMLKMKTTTRKIQDLFDQPAQEKKNFPTSRIRRKQFCTFLSLVLTADSTS